MGMFFILFNSSCLQKDQYSQQFIHDVTPLLMCYEFVFNESSAKLPSAKSLIVGVERIYYSYYVRYIAEFWARENLLDAVNFAFNQPHVQSLPRLAVNHICAQLCVTDVKLF
jgi:hypothetical protein